MVKVKQSRTVEDICLVAERQYQRMLDNVAKGVIDTQEICRAMDAVNESHRLALRENKRHLIT